MSSGVKPHRIDTTVIEFVTKRCRGKRFDIITRSKHFPSYGAAMVYLTDRKLGLLDKDEFLWYTPRYLIRRVYRKGKGLTEMKLKLGNDDG